MKIIATTSILVTILLCSCSDNTNATSTTANGGASASSSSSSSGQGGQGGQGGEGGLGIGGFAMNDNCGNGAIDTGETCDDGNKIGGDGCSAVCIVECGYLCLNVGSACTAGFYGVQCDTAGAPYGQPSPLANVCRIATLSVNGSHIGLSAETTLMGSKRHLDAMFTDGNNTLFGFAGNTENIAAGSHLVAIDAVSGVLTSIGNDLGVWVMGAAMNDSGDLWVTVFDTYERNENTEVRIAQVDPKTGAFLSGPTTLMENNKAVVVFSTHVSDVAFRSDGAMFISANAAGPLPPDPISKYYRVDPKTATVVSSVDGPTEPYSAGIVFIGDAQRILAMDIRNVDDIYVLDLATPPTLNPKVLYPDPIPTNSGTADLAGCSRLPADIPF